MESAFWISKRYDIPFLLIVLNNGGWNAPKVSALLVHKDGLSSRHDRTGIYFLHRSPRDPIMHQASLLTSATLADLNLSFEPSPDYAGIAAAAGNAYGALIETEDQVEPVLKEAVNTVQSGKSAVVEVR
ncbi:hypothetical protein NW767_014542 [Fusarium falciforme]|nr:hypothetical protein NW767_014542 [Fusarium falciforme]